MNITKVSIYVEYNNKIYLVNLNDIDTNILLELIYKMYKNGKLRLIKIPDSVDIHFEKLMDLV